MSRLSSKTGGFRGAIGDETVSTELTKKLYDFHDYVPTKFVVKSNHPDFIIEKAQTYFRGTNDGGGCEPTVSEKKYKIKCLLT